MIALFLKTRAFTVLESSTRVNIIREMFIFYALFFPIFSQGSFVMIDLDNFFFIWETKK